jgi:hypothetical protein
MERAEASDYRSDWTERCVKGLSNALIARVSDTLLHLLQRCS